MARSNCAALPSGVQPAVGREVGADFGFEVVFLMQIHQHISLKRANTTPARSGFAIRPGKTSRKAL
ncbi:hypothetical protein [Azoarcus sp. TTM-91]|uniref:hypothetical protein n=1 Tax=Azoarcus sp. TTM-91 TaxID=2691581 RepID=UPI001B7CE274|nr:hypothetical protein [Azoarcus sp. TTM-91]